MLYFLNRKILKDISGHYAAICKSCFYMLKYKLTCKFNVVKKKYFFVRIECPLFVDFSRQSSTPAKVNSFFKSQDLGLSRLLGCLAAKKAR